MIVNRPSVPPSNLSWLNVLIIVVGDGAAIPPGYLSVLLSELRPHFALFGTGLDRFRARNLILIVEALSTLSFTPPLESLHIRKFPRNGA